MSLLLLTGSLLPFAGTGSLTWSALFSSAACYILHPVTLFALAFPASRGIAHALCGNLLLVIAFAGAQDCRAPCAAALAWALFTLHHSLVQGACLALPLAQWLWLAARARPGRASGGVGAHVRWELALCALLLPAVRELVAAAARRGGAAAALPLPLLLLRPAPALLQPHLADPTSLAPELSLYWYLLSSAFLRAMPYFSTLVWGLPLALVPPILLRCGSAPAAGALLALALGALLDPSPGHSLFRLPLVTALALAYADGRVAAAMAPRRALLWGGLQAFALVAAAPMKHLWLRNRAGNANFLFWQQLIFTLASASLLGEWARLALAAAPSAAPAGKAALPAPADSAAAKKTN